MKRVYHIDGSAPAPGQIFVFGSNLSGIHGGGAARAAHQHYGAAWGVAEGRTGQSYALPTVRENIAGPLALAEIAEAVERFLALASESTDKFFVTRVGCGLAGHRDEDVAPMFDGAPANCSLPDAWRQYIEVTAPLLAQMLAAEKARAVTPTNQQLSPELVEHLRRKSQADVDQIQRRDRAWDDALAGRV